jgi:hypothetical protein
MSVMDKVIAAVTPPETEEARREARQDARSAASSGDWLALVLDHHERIEDAIDAVKSATTSQERVRAQKAFTILLTGHANAEESVLYPALARADEKGHATMGYTEQAATKMQLGLLEGLPPMSQDYLDKLEHIRGALAHHMYQEEGSWLLELKRKLPAVDQSMLTARYLEEFERYVGDVDDLDEDSLHGVRATERGTGSGLGNGSPLR